MTDSPRAVFLSYASQDAEAAKRICEALRAGGVEVWFDAEGGLEHGDEWDAKIRGQIKECVLFIPVISANTQAREEGYFRLEWDLAAERARTIASGVPFILPVVIDDTREPEALVPERFRAVQWTRLRGGAVPPEVKARFLKLWSHRTGALKAELGARASAAAGAAETGVTTMRPKRQVPTVAWVAGAIVSVIAVAAFTFALRPDKNAGTLIGVRTAEKSTASVPISEAKQLAWQAQDILLKAELGMSELDTAAVLCDRAATLDPSDAEVWATSSEVETWKFYFGGDPTAERRESARSKAARALNLSPSSFEARRAKACYLVCVVGQTVLAEAEPALRALHREKPHDRRALMVLGLLLREQRNVDDAIARFDELASLPGMAATAYNEKAWALHTARRYDEADTAVDRSIAAQPITGNISLKVHLALSWRGDLDLALATLKKLPASMLLEDRSLAAAIRVYRWRREPESLLALLNVVPRDWIAWSIRGPKAAITGDAHELAGRPAAARNDWRKALALVEQRLVATPENGGLIVWRAYLLAALGESGASDEALTLARQVSSQSNALLSYTMVPRFAAEEATLASLERHVQDPSGGLTLANLRLNPALDHVRALSRFQALLAKVEADGRLAPKPKTSFLSPPAPDPKSVVVLPFENLSGDPKQEYFSDGVTEEVLNSLMRERDLRVVPRTSAFSFKKSNLSLPEIARELNVAQVVAGSVRRAGNVIRIDCTLTHAADHTTQPLPRFEREMKDASDIFVLQDAVASAVLQKLTARGAIRRGPLPTKNLGAHDAYLRAQAAVVTGSAGVLQSIAHYEEAVALDPAFALAWAKLADAKLAVYGWGTPLSTPALLDEVRNNLSRSLKLAPDLPEALVVRAGVAWASGDRVSAERDLQNVERVHPELAEVNYVRALFAASDANWPNALAAGREAMARDPRNGDWANMLAVNVFGPAGDFIFADRLLAQVQATSRRALNNRIMLRLTWRGPAAALRLAGSLQSLPTNSETAAWRGLMLMRLGREAEALEIARALTTSSRGADPGNRHTVINLLAAAGEHAAAREIGQQEAEVWSTLWAGGNRSESTLGPLVAYHIASGETERARELLRQWTPGAGRLSVWTARNASFCALIDENEKAIEALQHVAKAGYALGYQLRFDRAFDGLRADPRFQALMKVAEAHAAAQPNPAEP